MKKIYVTKPLLPDRKKFDALVDNIWKNAILTNSGPLHTELEQKLAEFLGVKHLSLINNGTIALYLALKVKVFGHRSAWLDTGTFESYIQASRFVSIIEQRQV